MWSILDVAMRNAFRNSRPAALLLAATLLLATTATARAQDDGDERPELTLRATPRVGFAPADILFVAELRGGADDYEAFYCASVEWDWDDDTISASTPDCDPYQPGESRIRRRFSVRHRFEYSGRYEVRVLLKQRDDTVAAARAVIELRGGRFN